MTEKALSSVFLCRFQNQSKVHKNTSTVFFVIGGEVIRFFVQKLYIYAFSQNYYSAEMFPEYDS